jgi:prophage antirepressor-like protein
VCDEVLPTIRKTGSYAQPKATSTVNGQISVEMAEYVALLKQQAELAQMKAQSKQAESKIAIATALMRNGSYSREDIAEIAGIDLHTVDYLFADLCREAAKHGAISFRMRNH